MDNITRHNFKKGKITKVEVEKLFNEFLETITYEDEVDAININVLINGEQQSFFNYQKYIEMMGLIAMAQESLTIKTMEEGL